ncbi:MAG: extracellular solute-binding protein [Chloroflexi bacterium]|nr:extracellular solute-binding protein [Chloroflexota bacterium]
MSTEDSSVFSRRRMLGGTMLAGAALLAACGEAAPSGGTSSPSAIRGTVDFYHEWDGVRTKLVDEIVADFQAQNPNITIKPTLSRGSISMDKIFASIAAGDPPDVTMILTHTGAVWAHKTALRWLDDLIKRDRINTDQVFYKATIDLMRLNGRHFGLPALVAGVDPFLFYNRQVFSQFGLDPNRPPRTWQELEEVSLKLTQRDGRQLSRVGFVPSGRPFFDWLYKNDGRLFSPDGSKVAFNSAQGQETLTWMHDFTERVLGGMSAVDEFYQANRSGGSAGSRAPWYSGKEVMWVTIVSNFFRVNEESPGFPLGAAQQPINGKNPKAKVATVAERTWMYTVPQGAKNEAATWAWLKYISLGDGARKTVFQQQRPSPVRKFNEERAFRDLSPHWDVVLKNLEASVSVPQTAAWDDIRKSLDKATNDVLGGKAGVKQALETAAQEAQVALDSYKI